MIPFFVPSFWHANKESYADCFTVAHLRKRNGCSARYAAGIIGKTANIDLLIEDIQADLKSKPYKIVSGAGGWMFRSRAEHTAVIRTAADIGDKPYDFSEEEMAALCAVAYHQPIILISNTDDHFRNPGYLWSGKKG